jgi:hypothetical protein
MKTWLAGCFVGISVVIAGCGGGGSGDDTGSGTGAATAATAPATLARSYQGTIKDLKVMFRLAAQGTNVTGSYFYVGKPTDGQAITLKGTLTGNKLHLDESVAGKKTGQMDVTIAGSKLTGTWAKPDGSSKLNLALDAIQPGTLLPVTRTISQSIPAKQPQSADFKSCDLKADYIEVFGLADGAAEDAINKALAIQPEDPNCDFPMSSTIKQEVKMNDSGILVVTGNEEDDGGAHPSESLLAFNFSEKTGKRLGGKDIFKPEALAKLQDLAIQSLDSSLSADDKQTASDEIKGVDLDAWNPEVSKDGIHVDLFNEFPHAIEALAPDLQLKWADIKDLLLPNTEISPLVK